jgi:lipoprotein-anchoring transpeptidase ErfK/SrfK
MTLSKHLFLTALFVLFLIPTAAFAKIESVTIEFVSDVGETYDSFEHALANWAGGVDLAVADLGDDGTQEILIADGVGNEPYVHAYRQDGSEIGKFLAYDQGMGSGVTVAVCDLTGDGVKEIITGTQYGGGPHVRLFNNYGSLIDGGFFAYNEAFRGGVNITCGDYDNDGKNELITGAGPGGGPHIKTWEYDEGWQMQEELFVFEPTDTRGVNVNFSDGSIIVSNQTGATREYFSFRAASPLQASEHWSEEIDGMNDTKIIPANLIDNDITETVRATIRPHDYSTDPQYILVDISEQQLYAFENGVLANTFPISAGLYPWITPRGMHSVLEKLPFVDYSWNYGEGNANNYSLGLVPWNLRIYPHIYIHYAYWHNNFGNPMSHGCINVNLENIQWIYNWAEVGTPVEVRE